MMKGEVWFMKSRSKWLCMAICAVLMIGGVLSGCSAPKEDKPQTTAQNSPEETKAEGTAAGGETVQAGGSDSGSEPLTIGYTVQSMENA